MSHFETIMTATTIEEIRAAVTADAAESISNEEYRNDYIVGFLVAVIASKNRTAQGE